LADGVTERELRVARGNIIGSTMLGLEDSGARMSRIGRTLLLHDELPSVDEVLERFRAVSVDDVNAVAASIATTQRVVAAVGPIDEEAVA
jgi:predicted Zn-dependent peptidase